MEFLAASPGPMRVASSDTLAAPPSSGRSKGNILSPRSQLTSVGHRLPRRLACSTRAATSVPSTPAAWANASAQMAESAMDPSVLVIPPPSHPTFDIVQSVRQALAEDFGDLGDVTSLATIPEDTQAEAQFLAKANGVLAGVAVANIVFHEIDPSLKVVWDRRDGDEIWRGQVFGIVTGKARSILAAERVALNFMQRMSGIATATKAMVEAARPARILETRKTVPGLRLLDKWAVLIGGGENHRMGLYDMLMIKDNHIAAAGGIPQAISAAAKYLQERGLDMGVEVEARTLEEVRQVLESRGEGAGRVTRVMLDNMTSLAEDGSIDVSLLEQAVGLVGRVLETEASGNVTLDTVHAIGATGVTFISSGALTHSVKALDISLNIDTQLALEVGRRSNRA